MIERNRQDSTRDLLEELEDGWATQNPPRVEARAEEEAESVSAEERTPSDPDLAAVDDGWLDEFFGDDKDEEEDEDDEPEESEPELPDERLDPEAFARAKAERAERSAKKKEKKKAKAEAKRARQKARALAMRQKQKGKKARPATPPRREPPSGSKRAIAKAQPGPKTPRAATKADREVEPLSTSAAEIRKPNTMASVRTLVIALVVLIAIGIAVLSLIKK